MLDFVRANNIRSTVLEKEYVVRLFIVTVKILPLKRRRRFAKQTSKVLT